MLSLIQEGSEHWNRQTETMLGEQSDRNDVRGTDRNDVRGTIRHKLCQGNNQTETIIGNDVRGTIRQKLC